MDDPPASPATHLSFGAFTLDPAAFALRQNGAAVRLERRPMELLLLLAENNGRLVSREQIARRLWGSSIHVEIDMGIHTAIRKLRRCLGDEAGRIETVPGKGYRFTAGSGQSADATSAPSRQRVIAVLPFDIISPNPADAYIASGLTDETIASLGQIDPFRLAVIGRSSVIALGNARQSPAAIGTQLGAELLVEGSVRVEGERLRVTCTLIEAASGRQIWSRALDAEPLSLLAFQRDLAATIAAQINLCLAADRDGVLERRQTRNPAAYDLFLRARHQANQYSALTNRLAIEGFLQATSIDPAYALAWAGIAEMLAAGTVSADVPHGAVAARAREAATQALQAGPDLAEVRAGVAFAEFWLDWDWPRAEQSLRAATELDPNHATAWRMLGVVLSHLGRHVEARQCLAQARSLDPLSAMAHALSAQVAYYARDFAAAMGHARQAVVVEPTFWIGHFQHAQACAALDQAAQATEILDRLCHQPNCNSKVQGLLGYVLARAGHADLARARLRVLAEMSCSRFVPPYASALIHLGLDEADAAFAALESALKVRDVHLAFLPEDVKWDPLRGDPRFARLLHRCGFLTPAPPMARLHAVSS
jgi:TolB-like protein/Flp pilus assembly protein TadD